MKIQWPALFHRAAIKNALNAVRLPKFEAVNGEIVVAENDGGKRFTATFNTDVILHMHREL